ALLDQAHDGRRREGLAGRAELEQRVLVDVERVLDAGDAVEGVVLLTVDEDAGGDAGHLQLGRELGHLLLERFGPHGTSFHRPRRSRRPGVSLVSSPSETTTLPLTTTCRTPVA